ncbi:leucine-rich repeat receptor-like serine/threonine-protein kinase BAM1 [Ziziphus jujuba]|uniref:Leucine-rich repeat receptor-like serine/threonine-protein kinase BAM1 n=1 Tax=Ziziphus jujuba TaxID=326968 RepID=A0A6P3YZX1_ZIZJJ|nr:leucine-rich repeat receptor-like serine/threonine-protein kinase BAM1 [Ziziphus jujuba]
MNKLVHFRSISFPLFLIFFTILTFPCLKVTSAACNADDEAGLLEFKSGITADPSGMLGSWKKGTDCCTWAGVNCMVNNRVTMLSLSGQPEKPNSFLSGTISPSLSKLKFLDGIYLQQLQNISGRFPEVLFGLPNLKFVYIENNGLSGKLPENIGKLSQLEALSFAGNRFTGSIPSSISNLTHLTQLKLGGNFLTGSIPSGMRNLKNLTYLSLERNRLSGAIPDYLGALSELRILELSHNDFSGTIPASISTLAPKLAYLELGNNALTGKIPDFLGKFKALDTLDLSHNKFSGTVPKSFGNLTKIFNLDLSHNYLVDPFPVMNVKGIESLDLSYNMFHLNQIPKWVTSSPIIYSLKLARCGIKMKFEDWKPSETYFYDYIDLSDNEISGSPIGLLNKTDYLVGFWASGNKLKFNLEGLRIVETLKYLDLSKNLIFGKVPKAVSGLEQLNVSYNHLCGAIPATKFPATAFVGNDCLCGAPLPPCKV